MSPRVLRCLLLLAALLALPAMAVTPKVAGGSGRSLYLKADGTVWTWGSNTFGELGLGTNTDCHSLVRIASIADIKDSAGGGAHALAVKYDDTVWALGRNSIAKWAMVPWQVRTLRSRRQVSAMRLQLPPVCSMHLYCARPDAPASFPGALLGICRNIITNE